MNQESYHKLSFTVAIIGWAAFVIAIATYLFVMRPHYYNQGLEAGRQQQFLEDVATVDRYLLIPVQSLENQNAIIGRVTALRENELAYENITGRYNPLLVSGDMQNAVISERTGLWRRSLVPADELARLQSEAEAAGEDPNQINPFIDEQISLQDFSEGDRIEVLPEMFGDAENETYVAQYVILLDLDDVEFGI